MGNSTQQNIDLIRQKAEQGDAEAQNRLGLAYYLGEDVEQSYEKAFYWYEKSAKQNDAEGQTCLGWLYYRGKGVNRSYEQSFYWYEKSAEQGYADAQYRLGFLYFLGQGVEKSVQKALDYWKRAAEQGHKKAKTKLWEAEKHYKELFTGYSILANRYVEHQYNLAEAYYKGLGVEQSDEKAIYWLEKACENNYEKAYILLEEIKKGK